jgi:hypothetical protein
VTVEAQFLTVRVTVDAQFLTVTRRKKRKNHRSSLISTKNIEDRIQNTEYRMQKTGDRRQKGTTKQRGLD